MKRPKRSLGQNFLVDMGYADAMVRYAELTPDTPVIEIGPGRGAITSRILAQVDQVLAIEKDSQLAAELADQLGNPPNLRVIESDALKFDLAPELAKFGRPAVLISNLPYNVSVPIMFHVLSYGQAIERSILTFQKEVAQRLTAAHGNKSYGVPTISAWMKANLRTLFDIPPAAFRPRPKVKSSVVAVVPLPGNRVPLRDETHFFRLINSLFQKRRKTLKRSLKMSGYLPDDPAAAPIDLSRRVETLSPEELVTLDHWLLDESAQSHGA